LTAIESGQRAPVKEPQNIKELLKEVVEGLKPMATKKKSKLMQSWALMRRRCKLTKVISNKFLPTFWKTL